MGGKHKWPVPVQVHVVKEYSKNPGISDITVKRSVRTKFYPHNPRFLRTTAARDFRKIFDRFEKHGTYVHHTSAAASGMPKRSPDEVIGEQVESYFEENSLLGDFQFGFRKGKSTISELIQLFDTLMEAKLNKKEICLVLYDLSSAFDTVCHQILLQKLQLYGFDKLSLNWMNSYLKVQNKR